MLLQSGDLQTWVEATGVPLVETSNAGDGTGELRYGDGGVEVWGRQFGGRVLARVSRI